MPLSEEEFKALESFGVHNDYFPKLIIIEINEIWIKKSATNF